jgi:hypothetical protein
MCAAVVNQGQDLSAAIASGNVVVYSGTYSGISIDTPVTITGIGEVVIDYLVISSDVTLNNVTVNSLTVSGTLKATSCVLGPIVSSGTLELEQCSLEVSGPTFVSSSGGSCTVLNSRLELTDYLYNFEMFAARNGTKLLLNNNVFRTSAAYSNTLYIVNTYVDNPASDVSIDNLLLSGTQGYYNIVLSLAPSSYTRRICNVSYEGPATLSGGSFVDASGNFTASSLTSQGPISVGGPITSPSGSITIGDTSSITGEIVLGNNTSVVNGQLVLENGLIAPRVYSPETLVLGGTSVEFAGPVTSIEGLEVQGSFRTTEVISPSSSLVLGLDPPGQTTPLVTLTYNNGTNLSAPGDLIISSSSQAANVFFNTLATFNSNLMTNSVVAPSSTLTLGATDPTGDPATIVFLNPTQTEHPIVSGGVVAPSVISSGPLLTLGATGTNPSVQCSNNLSVTGDITLTGTILPSSTSLVLGGSGDSVVIPGNLLVTGNKVSATLLGSDTALVSVEGSDTTGAAGNAEFPFATISAALAVASNIIVAPGSYTGSISIPAPGNTATALSIAALSSGTAIGAITVASGYTLRLTGVTVPSVGNSGKVIATDCTIGTITNSGTLDLRDCRYVGSTPITDSSSGGALENITSFSIVIRGCTISLSGSPTTAISGTGTWSIDDAKIVVSGLPSSTNFDIFSPGTGSLVLVNDCLVEFIDSSSLGTLAIVNPSFSGTANVTNFSVMGSSSFSSVGIGAVNVANNISFDTTVQSTSGFIVSENGSISCDNLVANGSLTADGGATINNGATVNGTLAVSSLTGGYVLYSNNSTPPQIASSNVPVTAIFTPYYGSVFNLGAADYGIPALLSFVTATSITTGISLTTGYPEVLAAGTYVVSYTITVTSIGAGTSVPILPTVVYGNGITSTNYTASNESVSQIYSSNQCVSSRCILVLGGGEQVTLLLNGSGGSAVVGNPGSDYAGVSMCIYRIA